MTSQEQSEVLAVNSLTAKYGTNIVLQDVSFTLLKGEIMVIIGQNGSGKSTLLKSICGLLPASQGAIRFANAADKPIAPHKLVDAGISYFAQDGLVIPSLTILEHFSLAAPKTNRNQTKRDFEDIFDRFPKLYELRNKRAGLLSGGERQMLSFGILLLQRTSIWLLDEPTAGLAPAVVDFTTEFLQKKNLEEGFTLLLVEHNLQVAFRLASDIAVAKNGTLTRKYNRQEFSEPSFMNNIVYN